MAIFQHIFWGYTLTFPEEWVHRTLGEVEGFAARAEALESGYAGEQAGHLLVKAEWNAALQPVEPPWAQQMGTTAGMIGAKKVGSAPWQMAGATGLEAEFVLSKQTNLRLWSGLLARDFLVLHFMVAHPKEERAWFEPLATRLIASLRFLPTVEGVTVNAAGLPVPPGYGPVDARQIIPDLTEPQRWQAYGGPGATMGALQAFYLRELVALGWTMDEFVPFLAPVDLGFARFTLRRGETSAVVGLMPAGAAPLTAASPAQVVIKL